MTCTACPSNSEIFSVDDPGATCSVSPDCTQFPYGLLGNEVSVTCTNAAGTTTTACAGVMVVDSSPPSLACPDYNVACGGTIGAAPAASNTCWTVGTTCTLASGLPFGSFVPSMGSTTYSCTATVENGAIGAPATTCGGNIVVAAPPPLGTPTKISSNFNGTAIAAGTTIWWSAVMKVSGINGRKATVHFQGGAVSLSSGCMAGSQASPDASITFDPSVATSTTSYDPIANRWNTVVPASGLSGNVLLDAFALPINCSMAGGVNPVVWTGDFWSDTPGLTVCWQWAASVYKTASFPPLAAAGVKPVDDNKTSVYLNSDHAGTPEAEKSLVTGGARGGGGSNWTGSYSGTVCVAPPVGSLTCQ